MKRTVREILAECKGGRELMSLRDFTLCIKTIHAHLNLACFSPDGSRESKRHLKMADDICLAVEDCFADQNSNLVNWFRREPCEFHHPLTGSYVKVEVRDDIEAIYYFLHYCMMLNQHKPIDEDTLGYRFVVFVIKVKETSSIFQIRMRQLFLGTILMQRSDYWLKDRKR